jgi:hypothetical protein
MSFSFSTISPQVAPTSLRDLSRRRELLDGAAALPVRLRIEPQAEGIRSGKYPKPLKLGPGTTVWRVEDIRRLIQSPGNDSK